MKTVRELIREAENKLDDEHKDVNVAKVLFYHLAKKEPHELYLMMNEEVEPELEKAFLAGMEEYYQGKSPPPDVSSPSTNKTRHSLR